jgi:hypothetical protein
MSREEATGDEKRAYAAAEEAHGAKHQNFCNKLCFHDGYEAARDHYPAEIAEHDHSFELRWKADMRAIKMWHEAGGDELTWPDHADLVVWLLERMTKIATIAAREMAEPGTDPAALIEIATLAEGGGPPVQPETEIQQLICRPCKRGRHDHGERNCQNFVWSKWTDQHERCICNEGVRDELGFLLKPVKVRALTNQK